MDRRILIWLLMSVSLFLVYSSLQRQFLPVPPVNAPPADLAKRGDLPANPAAKATPPEDAAILGKAADKPAEALAIQGKDDAQTLARPNFPDQVVSLGSMDPTKGFRILPTLTSRGASIATRTRNT